MKEWYELSAHEIANSLALEAMSLRAVPDRGDPRYEEFEKLSLQFFQIARGVKYGNASYAEMYMKERELVLGPWDGFLKTFSRDQSIDLDGDVIVAGINDGQEVSFLTPRSIIGIEVSAEAIQRGRSKFPQIRFEEADLLLYQPTRNHFDTYLILRTIHLFERSEILTIMRKAYSSLRLGGRLVASIPGGFLSAQDGITFGQLVSGGVIDLGKPRRDAEVCASLMANAGFQSIKVVDKEIEIFLVGRKQGEEEHEATAG